jgi:hypothetical protein
MDSIFEDLKECICICVKDFGYDNKDIKYINLNSEYWMSATDFFACIDVPPCIMNQFDKPSWWAGNAWELPHDFKIVMKDGSFITYYMCDDPFYNKWVYNPRVEKAEKQYVPTHA